MPLGPIKKGGTWNLISWYVTAIMGREALSAELPLPGGAWWCLLLPLLPAAAAAAAARQIFFMPDTRPLCRCNYTCSGSQGRRVRVRGRLC